MEMAESNLIRKISDSLLGRIIILNKVWDSSYTKNCGEQKLGRENLYSFIKPEFGRKAIR